MKAVFLHVAGLVLIATAAQAAPPRDPPLPPPRPKFEAAPPAEKAVPEESVQTCAFAAKGKVIARTLPPIAGENGCGLKDPVRVEGVSANGSSVAFSPAATLGCGMAQQVASWLADDLLPELARAGVDVTEIQLGGSYECRGRNRVEGARLSEHATGNALDVSAFKTADGRIHVIGKDKPVWFEAVKRTACARFETVLGPGADGDHQDHVHLDMRGRKTPRLFCQWTVD